MERFRIYPLVPLAILILYLFVSHSESGSCCLRYSKKQYPCHKMKGYSIQTITRTCDISAIIFHTKKHKYICANPAQQWTKERIQCLNKRVKRM
ncbi:C-C motif chemokine 20-like [Arapaima gigas]